MEKIRIIQVPKLEQIYYYFWCPGCNDLHVVSNSWVFNDDMHNPTFYPSILVQAIHKEHYSQPLCHSFIENGKIRFLPDCEHALANETVELPDINGELFG